MAETKKVLIEVDPLVWLEVREFAEREGRTLRWVVGKALERMVRGRVEEAVVVRESEGSGRRVTLDQLKASGVVKTGRQLLEEREARRGDESGSQIRDDEDLPGVRAWEE